MGKIQYWHREGEVKQTVVVIECQVTKQQFQPYQA
jgi:hypothetical protein